MSYLHVIECACNLRIANPFPRRRLPSDLLPGSLNSCPESLGQMESSEATFIVRRDRTEDLVTLPFTWIRRYRDKNDENKSPVDPHIEARCWPCTLRWYPGRPRNNRAAVLPLSCKADKQSDGHKPIESADPPASSFHCIWNR